MAQLELVKKVKNAVLYKDGNGQRFIRIDKVRLSYPFLGTQSEDEDDNGKVTHKWRVTAMLDKDEHKEAHDLVVKVIEAIMKENDTRVPGDKWFMSDGDDKEDENMHGHWLVTASDGRIRPKVRDRKGEVMDDIKKIDETFYGGCWGHILIRPWFFNGVVKGATKKYPKRVSSGLTGVFFSHDDKPFGAGRIDDSDAWDDVPKSDEGANGFDDDDGDL